MKYMATIDSLIWEEPQKNIDKEESFWESLKKKPRRKESNLKNTLLFCAALAVFANSPCTNFYHSITNQNPQIIEKNKKLNKSDSAFEYKSTPLVQDQINYSKGDVYIQIYKNVSKASNSLDSLLWDLQILVQKPDFKIKYNKIPNLEKNKVVYSELWHVYGEIDGDKVTIVDMDGDGIPDFFYHDRELNREIISMGEHVPQILYLSKDSINRETLNRETILLNPKVNKKNLPYFKKESSDENKELVKKAYKLFFDCLEYFNNEVYEKKGDIERITLQD